MQREKEIVLRRGSTGWYVMLQGREEILELPVSALAQEAVELVRCRYAYGRLGLWAEDIGPATALIALCAGHGNILWLRR